MSMMCFAQNTKQIMHSRHPSYPSISALLENCRFGVLSLNKKKEEGELVPAQNDPADSAQCFRD